MQAWNGSNLLGLVYKIVQEKYPPLSDDYSEDLRRLATLSLSLTLTLSPNPRLNPDPNPDPDPNH